MDIDIFQLPGIVRKRLHYVVLAALACAVLALGFIVTQKPFYRSTVELYVDIPRDPADAGGSSPSQQVIGSQLYLIQSRDVLREVVQKLELTKDPYFAQGGGLLSRIRGRTPAKETATEGVINALLENLIVERNTDSFVFTITAKHANSEMAARIANSVAESYLRISDGARLEVKERTSRTIAGQAEDLRKRVLEAQAAVETFRAENGLISTGQQGLITDQQLAGLNQQLLAARQQLEQQQTIYEQARQLNVSNVESGAIPETLNSTQLSGLRSRYAQALDRQAELSANLGSGHPQMRAVRSQIASIRSSIENELGRIRQSTANTYERAKANLDALAKRFDEQTASTRQTGEVRFRLAQLVSEAEAVDAVYKSFLTRAEELSSQQDLGSSNSRIISEAIPSDTAVKAPKLLVLIAALLFGTAAGAALAVAHELLLGTRRVVGDPIKDPGPPILAVIAGDDEKGRGAFLMARLARLMPRQWAPEQVAMPRPDGIRQLAQRLQTEFGSARPATIAVLSPRGQTNNGIAADLVQELHRPDATVLFSDGALRRPSRERSRTAWSVKVRTDTANLDNQTLEDMLQFERIGTATLRTLSALSSSRVSTAIRLQPPEFIIVDCCGTPAQTILPSVLRHVDGIVVVSTAGAEPKPGASVGDLLAEIEPWHDRLVGTVVLSRRAP